MKLEVFKTANELYNYVADLVVGRIKSKPDLVLGLAAGATPGPLYKKMAEIHRHRGPSFSKIKTFNLDEYVGIDKRHNASFYRFTKEFLFEKTDISPNYSHSLNGQASDFAIECRDYEDQIQKAGGIDLQILGIGQNGHIGFNEPGSPKSSRTRVIELSKETRSKIPKELFTNQNIPEKGVTVGVGTILEAKEIILIAVGEAKSLAIENCFSGVESATWPASYLQSHHNVHIFCNLQAAKGLKNLPVPR